MGFYFDHKNTILKTTELSGKSSELKCLQDNLKQLRSVLGGKDKEPEQLEAKMEGADNDAKDYDLNKIRNERTNLIFLKIFKQKHAEIDSIREKDKEKATPSKSLSQVKQKLEKTEEELNTVQVKLEKEVDKVGDLYKKSLPPRPHNIEFAKE